MYARICVLSICLNSDPVYDRYHLFLLLTLPDAHFFYLFFIHSSLELFPSDDDVLSALYLRIQCYFRGFVNCLRNLVENISQNPATAAAGTAPLTRLGDALGTRIVDPSRPNADPTIFSEWDLRYSRKEGAG